MITKLTTNGGKEFVCSYVSLADLFDELYISINSNELMDVWKTFTDSKETNNMHVEIVDKDSYQTLDYVGYTNLLSIEPEKSIGSGGILVRMNRAAVNPTILTIQNGS